MHRASGLHAHRVDPAALAFHLQQPATRPPLQRWQLLHPALQDRLSRGRPIAETAHPVVIEPRGFRLLQGPQEGAPEARLPGGELIAIGAAHSRGAHHAAEPGARCEQQCGRPATGGLDRSGHTAGATTPHQHIHRIDGWGHGSQRSGVDPSLPAQRR